MRIRIVNINIHIAELVMVCANPSRQARETEATLRLSITFLPTINEKNPCYPNAREIDLQGLFVKLQEINIDICLNMKLFQYRKCLMPVWKCQ